MKYEKEILEVIKVLSAYSTMNIKYMINLGDYLVAEDKTPSYEIIQMSMANSLAFRERREVMDKIDTEGFNPDIAREILYALFYFMIGEDRSSESCPPENIDYSKTLVEISKSWPPAKTDHEEWQKLDDKLFDISHKFPKEEDFDAEEFSLGNYYREGLKSKKVLRGLLKKLKPFAVKHLEIYEILIGKDKK